jgi:heat shock protein HtpX
MARLSFEDEIARNKRSSILLAIILSFILLILVNTLAYLFAPEYLILVLPITVLIIVAQTYTSYMYGDRVVLSATGAVPAEGRDYVYLRDTVEGLSIAAGIPPPKVYIIPSEELNAFATGRDPEHASIAVTRGLMQHLDRQELEGVVAHEMSHIANRDILFMTLVAVLVGLAAIVSHIILRSFRWGVPRGGRRGRGDREGGGLQVLILVIGFILAIFAPIVTRLVQLAVSRRREYLADASGASLTRYPEGLASALEKMMNINRGKMDVSEAVSHLFFVDPNRSALDALYATHPPIEERIKRLRAM